MPRSSLVSSTIKRFKTSNKNHPFLHIRSLLRNRTTTNSSLSSYTLLHALKSRTIANPISGFQIHRLVIALGFQSVIFLQTALLSMYSNSGQMTNAQRVFDEISVRNIVAWTALISAYVNSQKPTRALACFRQMQLEGIEPDLVTLTVALSACADLGDLDAGEWIHTYIGKQRLGEDVILTNALLNMYCKCGDVTSAYQLFRAAACRDVTTWTSIIMGYALHGRAHEALEIFNEMKRGDCSPNSVTFVAVLTACSHGGLAEEGKRQWEDMTSFWNVTPSMGHYGCMVDLLCRSGHLEEAYGFIERMPVPANAVIWRTLLGACSLKGNVKIGDCARTRLLELEPDSAGDGVCMSNAYAKAGMWEEKENMRRRKGRRAPGCSLIEIGSVVHEFVAGDRRQVKSREIQQVLEGMVNCSKDMECG